MKRLAFLCVLISLLIAPLAAGEQAIVLKVKVQVANVRAEPDMGSAVVKKIPLDTLLEARQKIGDWYEITVTDSLGVAVSAYIHHQVVDVISGEETPPTPVREEPPPPVREPVREVPRPPVDRRPAPVRYGPDYAKGGFRVLGGLAMASLRYPTAETAELDKYKKSKMGLAGGIGYDTGGQFAFALNVLYMQKGVKFAGEEDGVKFDAPISIDQLSVPLMAKIRFMPGPTPYALVGGEAALVLSGNIKWTATDIESGEKETESEDIKDNLESLDYGLVFGFGYELNAGSIPLFFELRYHLGLADIFKQDDPDSPNWVKTNAIVFAAGIKF